MKRPGIHARDAAMLTTAVIITQGLRASWKGRKDFVERRGVLRSHAVLCRHEFRKRLETRATPCIEKNRVQQVQNPGSR